VEAAVVMNSKFGHLSLVYLGLPIGGNRRHLSFCQLLLDHVPKKLSDWKSKNLLMYSRLMLLKFVLSTLPGCSLSFFKSSTSIISFFLKFFIGRSSQNSLDPLKQSLFS